MRLSFLLLFIILFFIPNPTTSAECEYSLIRNVYRCNLKKALVFYEDTRLEIQDEHLPGYNDTDVKVVSVTSSILRYLQPTIFDKFVNIETFSLTNVELWGILPNALTSCRELTIFNIEDPDLQTFPSKLFQNCQKLQDITLKSHLTALPIDTFYGIGTSLQNLDLSGNQFMTLSESYFKGLIRLRSLNLAENKINGFDNDVFMDLTALAELNLMGNSLMESHIPEKLFWDLKNLKILDLRINLIKEMKLEWFKEFSNLQNLDLSRNDIDTLPENVFKPLQKLKFLYLDYNNLKILDTNSFGQHDQLAVFTVDHNSIQYISTDFFDSFPNLEYFHAVGNECINGYINGYENPINFTDDAVLGMLKRCHQTIDPSRRFITNKYMIILWIILGAAIGVFIISYVINLWLRRNSGKWTNKFVA